MTDASQPQAKPINLRVNDVVAPIGISARPYFGWHISDSQRNKVQSHYQILVATSQERLKSNHADVWDSGFIPSDKQNHIAYAGSHPLTSNTQYFWRVRIKDGADQVSDYSAPSTFVVGLLSNTDWAGSQWIKREPSEPDDYTYYRHQATLPAGPIKQAILYVTAVHKYELYVNSDLVGKGPSYHYPQYQYYNAYDVSAYLAPDSDNLLAVFTHWFGPGQGRPESAPGLLLKLIVDFADGRSLSIGTDESWRQRRADSWLPDQPPRQPHEGVGFVEKIDANHLIPDWHTPTYDDTDWPLATVIGPQPTPPWTGQLTPDLSRIIETNMKPAAIMDKGNGRFVVDLGKVIAGRPQIAFSGGEPGEIITMQGGYTLTDDGLINPDTNQDTDMHYFAIDNGREFTFLPQEYLGMRYFQVDNCPMPLTIDNFTFIARQAELEDGRSMFTSSAPMLNTVWDFLKYSLPPGAQEQFLDTPTREKGGFLVDGVNESLVAMAAYGERVLTRRTLHEFLHSMDQFWFEEADWGRVNAVYPNGDGARDIPDFTQAYLLWVWEYYLQTGDKDFLRRHYSKLKAVADYVNLHTDKATGLIYNLTGGGTGLYQHGIIDWPPAMRYGYDMTAVARTVINAYAIADNQYIAKIAAELGESADQQNYHSLAEVLITAVNTHLINPAGIYCDGLLANGTQSSHASQQANIFPLALGIVPATNQTAVLQHIKEMKMSVGMPTVYWLIKALGEMDAGEHLLDLYTRSDWDGWAKNITQGATCTWESWDADKGGNLSMSHPWGAVGLIGIQQYILGLKPLSPQYAQVQIKPLSFGTKLTQASGKVPTERGDIEVSWQRQNGRFTLTVTLPANIQASVYLPQKDSYLFMGNVGSGTHTFDLPD